jgi:hypothetical protein
MVNTMTDHMTAHVSPQPKNRIGLRAYLGPGEILQGFQLFVLAAVAYKFGISSVIQPVIDAYKLLVRIMAFPFEFGVKAYLLPYIPLDLTLHEHWRSAFLIVGLYFFTDLRASYISRRLPRLATYSAAAGAFMTALGSCIISGLFSLDGSFSPSVYIPILAFGIFEIVKAFITPTVARTDGLTWMADFCYYFIVFGLLNFAIGWGVVRYVYMAMGLQGEQAMLVSYLLFLGCIVVRNVAFSFAKPFITGVGRSDWKRRAWSSGANRTARQVLRVLGWFLLLVMANAASPF